MVIPKHILLIRLKSLGDVMFTLPAVNAIRDSFPSAKITFLTSKENAPLLSGFREVDEVLPLDRAALRRGNPFRSVPELLGLLRHLRSGKFSLVVDFQGYGETAWLTRLTGAPNRWGSVYGRGRAWAYTLGVHREPSQHHADRNLAILQTGGLALSTPRNIFVLPPAALVAAGEFFRKNNLDPARRTLFIQPFTSSPRKNWPLDNYLAVAEHWRNQGWQIIFGGGPDDPPRLEPVLARRFITSAGVSLLVTGGLMQYSTLVLGGDTGALHLAVAMGRRVVMIMASTKCQNSFPFQHPDWVIRSSTRGSIQGVEIPEVIEACARACHEQTQPAGGIPDATAVGSLGT